mgnify:CR=1 FL=1|tara:strand:+ start:5755 stop:6285 length:531 start_codon:yes stop_codon:yes gene_type:complete
MEAVFSMYSTTKPIDEPDKSNYTSLVNYLVNSLPEDSRLFNDKEMLKKALFDNFTLLQEVIGFDRLDMAHAIANFYEDKSLTDEYRAIYIKLLLDFSKNNKLRDSVINKYSEFSNRIISIHHTLSKFIPDDKFKKFVDSFAQSLGEDNDFFTNKYIQVIDSYLMHVPNQKINRKAG